MTRCINIDWLEVYAHEVQDGAERNADWFRSAGLQVVERDYGTRIYEQMFTILDEFGEPFIEVRRLPKGLRTSTGFSVLDEGSCHLRLHNRTCYYKHCAKLMIDFTEKYGFIVSRIARLDICLDFEYFDYGDDPQRFLNRYLKGKYSKINQANISAHGKDMWDGRFWNSLSWGSPKSQIGTKFYNKTLEITERKDKPYIRQAWASAGLVNDMSQLTQVNKKGEVYHPQIWRLEFSIRSSAKKWYTIEDVHTDKKQLRSIHHTLEDYITDQQLLRHFIGLCHHYFHFKIFVEGQRKDRCPDKKLFNFTSDDTFYELDKLASTKSQKRPLDALRSRLLMYRLQHPTGKDAAAIDAVLDIIKRDDLQSSASSFEARTELLALQQLIAYRLRKGQASPLGDDIEFIKSLITLDEKIF